MVQPPRTSFTKEAILKDLSDLLADLTSEWDREFSAPIGPETRLIADLEFESVDVVQLVTAVEERYQRRKLPFERLLMTEGRYVDDIQVGALVDFLHLHLQDRR